MMMLMTTMITMTTAMMMMTWMIMMKMMTTTKMVTIMTMNMMMVLLLPFQQGARESVGAQQSQAECVAPLFAGGGHGRDGRFYPCTGDHSSEILPRRHQAV
jgi:hypothetical protein